jgi:type II secretory pathway component GspD/PulD (secretin)
MKQKWTHEKRITTTSSIQYEQVLLQLDVIPLINANHQVTLQIQQTNNSLGSSTEISGNEVPTILTQVLNTSITVNDKSTIVIGGLISDTKETDTSGVPWISNIPVLGYLFKDTTNKKERDELVIMIQPTVIGSDEDQITVNEDEKERTVLGREAGAASLDQSLSPATPDYQVKSTSGRVDDATNGSVPVKKE